MGLEHPGRDERHQHDDARRAHDPERPATVHYVPSRHQCGRQNGADGHARAEEQAERDEVQRIARGQRQQGEACDAEDGAREHEQPQRMSGREHPDNRCASGCREVDDRHRKRTQLAADSQARLNRTEQHAERAPETCDRDVLIQKGNGGHPKAKRMIAPRGGLGLFGL
jgi:hypothetical protein